MLFPVILIAKVNFAVKYCVFGGLLFLGGCFCLCAGCLGLEQFYASYYIMMMLYIGIGAMIAGFVLGLVGLFKNDYEKRVPHVSS